MRGQEVEQDVRDGIRKNISVGYIPKSARLVEKDKERGDLWRVNAWEPLELSLVSVPADPTVGVGRSVGGASRPVVEVHVANESNAAEIAEVAAAYGMAGRAGEWIRSGMSVEQVQGEILKARSTNAGHAQPAAESLESLGVSQRDRKNYSYARAIRVAAGIDEGGLEGEVSRELEKLLPGEVKRRGGVLVPLQVSTRTLSSNVGSKGAETVFEQAGELIELLRNRTAVIELGARVMTGLTSPITFPKQTGAQTAYWVAENGSDVPTSDLALSMAMLAPKTLQSATAFSRQLLLQSSTDVENLVRSDVAAVHSRAIDYAALHGLGAAGEPTGIYKATGVNATAVGGAPTFAKLMAMVAQVASANGDTGTLGWVTTPTMAANLAQVLVASAAGSKMLWEGPIVDGQLIGLKALATNQCSSAMNSSDRTGGTGHALVCGVWSEMLIGMFGALELVVDPFTSKKKGLIEVASFQMCDILVRHGESFSKATGATAS